VVSTQSFAYAANCEIAYILQKTALEILTQVDPPSPTRAIAKPHAQTTNHHSPKDPHKALLQRTIQLHRNALHTLRTELSHDDADALTYQQNKLKQAQHNLIESQTKQKKDKLLANVISDNADDDASAGQNIGSMWNNLKIYLSFFHFFAGTNPHSFTSLPADTYSNASADNRIWKSGPATLNPREHQSVDILIVQASLNPPFFVWGLVRPRDSEFLLHIPNPQNISNVRRKFTFGVKFLSSLLRILR